MKRAFNLYDLLLSIHLSTIALQGLNVYFSATLKCQATQVL